MCYKKFLELLYFAVHDCGMNCGIGENYGVIDINENEEAWYVCPECGEPVYYCDWKDEEVSGYYCPICQNEMY